MSDDGNKGGLPELPSMSVNTDVVYMATHVPLGIEEQDVEVVRMFGFGHSVKEVCEATGLSPGWCKAIRQKYEAQVREFAANKDAFMQTLVEQALVDTIRASVAGVKELVAGMKGGSVKAKDLKDLADHMEKLAKVRDRIGASLGGRSGPSGGLGRALSAQEQHRLLEVGSVHGDDDAEGQIGDPHVTPADGVGGAGGRGLIG